MKNINILLVDDQVLFVESLKTVLETHTTDLKVVGIAFDGEKAVELALEKRPDIILMDVRMPGMSGVECTRIIKKKTPSIQIMMLTTFNDDEYVYEALSAGAIGYILKDIHPAYLISAVRSIHEGGLLISPKVARTIVDKLMHPPAVDKITAQDYQEEKHIPLHELSKREREVLMQISKGYTNKEIAEKLFIVEQTVKNHVSTIYSKLGVRDRVQALRLAIEAGLDLTERGD